MKLSDFEHATEDERELMAIRFSASVRTDDHAFAAMMARAKGTAGPRPADAGQGDVGVSSVHGSEDASH